MRIIQSKNYKVSQDMGNVDQAYDNMNSDFDALLEKYAKQIVNEGIGFEQALEALKAKTAELLSKAVNDARSPRPNTYELPDTPMGLPDGNPVPGV